ncbi:hypothetical protein AKUH3B102A_PHAGE100160 (plasmid) [Apilactobacillus kunkeei]|nr:hypothetical protein AKUH3B102A_PHAGE100160 [Apilactobacillus kunkeei]CAI2700102.1 hypothetical protein AKUH3B107A_PHAGE100160 [Apilactobacillus kunkeei]
MINTIALSIIIAILAIFIGWNVVFIIDDLKQRKRDKK